MRGGAARRAALQARTAGAVVSREQARWNAALAHERIEQPRTGAIEAGEYACGARATVVPLSAPEPDFHSAGEIATYLNKFAARNPHIKNRHQVAHLAVSWAGQDVSASAAAATAARMLTRLGIDVARQPVVCLMHHDTDHTHMHLLVGRVRSDGGAWTAGLGVDRALALEAFAMVAETGQAATWDQRMIARSKRSGVAAGLAAQGRLAGEIRYADGRREEIPWQGEAVTARRAEDYIAAEIAHAGLCLPRMIGLRPAERVAGYCASN
jgi:hypothetical protein